MNAYPQVGDLLRRPKVAFARHVGVWAGAGAVFHNAPGKGECIEPLASFATGHSVEIERTGVPPQVVWTRIRDRMARPRPYDLVANNCEHSANAVVTGRVSSPQLQAFVLLSLFVGVILLASTDN